MNPWRRQFERKAFWANFWEPVQFVDLFWAACKVAPLAAILYYVSKGN